MLKGEDSLRREQIASERRERRQKRAQTRALKRERRLTRLLHEKGWDEAALQQHECEQRALAQQNQQSSSGDTQQTRASAASFELAPPPENILRVAVVGAGGWVANRAHLPALARIVRKSSRLRISVLCGSNHTRALATLRRHGVSLSAHEQPGDDKVAVFDSLEAYLDYETRLKEGKDESMASKRERTLADVCLLLLPIPKMQKAIGMCLRSGKYIISEKPISVNSYAAQSLWEACRFQRAGHRWAVAENWAYKPSLHKACELVQAEILCRQQTPTSYNLKVFQRLDNSGWRRCGFRHYSGGAIRDVGVHFIRALRRLFGEVDEAKHCEFAVDEKACFLDGTLLHEASGVQGTLRVDLKGEMNESLQQASLTIVFGSLSQIAWDISKGTFHRLEGSESPVLLGSVRGDPWVTGGVREMLEAAVDWFHDSEFGRCPNKSPERAGLSCPPFMPEEAFRDAAVIDAMLAASGPSCAGTDGQTLIAPLKVKRVRGFLPYPLISRMDRCFTNSISTMSFRPTEFAWCSSMSDVESAVAWARENSLDINPIGTFHSSCQFQNDAVSVSTSLMSRVLDYRAEECAAGKDGTKAYLRIETGRTLNSLAALLRATGYTLPSFPILLNQSVGGAISTGSHGSSVHYGTISDSVVAVRLVTWEGCVRTVAPEAEILSEAVLRGMLASDANEVVYSDELLKAARCSRGSLGVLTDVILELTASVPLRREEVKLDMNDSCVCEKLLQLASDNEHCWIQWFIGDVEASDEAAAITLSSATHVDSEEAVFSYCGRGWYPYGETVSEMMKKARTPNPGERKHTMQWSFPVAYFSQVVDIVKGARSELSSRVVEFKFLMVSDMTTWAPNSHCGEGDSHSYIVALNVWWEMEGLELFKLIESRLREVPGAQPHYGKWLSVDREEVQLPCTSVSRSTRDQQIQPDPTPILSVILPVYNAMPWLSIALRDILKQDVEGEHVEVLVGDDASSDTSLDFLVSVAVALGPRGSIEVVGNDGTVRCLAFKEAQTFLSRRMQNGVARSTNPALLEPSRNADCLECVEIGHSGVTVDRVVSDTAPRNRLRVVLPEEYVNCGQGAVMTRCLRLARGAYIGHMESDDARPDGTFQKLCCALRKHPEWDGITSRTECIGWDADGMKRYVEWQNQLDTPEKMKASRFVEIPSMHQSCIFRARAVYMSIGGRTGCYRDDRKWPVDLHFWLSFFHAGLSVGKVPSTLFYWRQHPGQQTRNHGRLSVSNMRKCKCEFLCMTGGPLAGNEAEPVIVEVWSTGQTLKGWVDDLSFEMKSRQKESTIVAIHWKPGQVRPSGMDEVAKHRRIRLFAFGSPKARQQVREIFASDWNDKHCIFVS